MSWSNSRHGTGHRHLNAFFIDFSYTKSHHHHTLLSPPTTSKTVNIIKIL